MKLQRKIVTLATLGLALSAAAVPAKREVRTVTQPDGTTIEVRIVGDEYLHYMVTNDGNIVSRDTDGRYCYAGRNRRPHHLHRHFRHQERRSRP